MVVGGYQLHAFEPPSLQGAEQLLVGRFALGVGYLHPKDLAHAIVAHRRDHQNPLAHDLMVHPHLLIAGIHEQVRVRLGLQPALPPRLKLGVESRGQVADRAPGEARAAQLLGYFLDLPGGDAFEVHLHQRQHKRLLVSLVAGEQARGEGPLPVLRYE